ncbi:MAG: alpha/beta hydrolase family esterase [Ferruginibacter sp.]
MKNKIRLCLFLCTVICVSSNAQVISDSFLIDGIYRTFHFTKPQQLTHDGSLIFILHGSGGTGLNDMKNTVALSTLATTENFIAFYPDAYKKNWNECRKQTPAEANVIDIDENTFFKKMIDYAVKHYNINRKKVFVIGTSGGGHMAFKLAYTMPKKITAITAIVANIPDSTNMDCIEKRKPVPVMIINGTKDGINPYNGGQVLDKGLVQSTDASFKYWATLAGYTGLPEKTAIPDNDPNDGKTIERYTYFQKGKPEIVLLKVLNGEHNYPNDINVFIESWQFFKRQLLNN